MSTSASDSLTTRLRRLLAAEPAPTPAAGLGADEESEPISDPREPHQEATGRPSVGAALRQFTRTHLAGLAAFLVVMVVAALTLTLRATTHTVPLTSAGVGAPAEPQPPASAHSATPASAATPSLTPAPNTPSSTPSSTLPATIQVHVAGEVKRPGVVKVATGSRVHDAVAAAGGATSRADLQSVNLAAVLTDGSQVLIAAQGHGESSVKADPASSAAPPDSGPSSSAVQQAKVNLNTATQAQLEELPGVGPVTAGNILSWREQHGLFSRIEELQEVDGIGPKTYAQLAPHVSV